MTNSISQRALRELWPFTGMPGLPTSGLVCYLDAGISASYNGSGTTWSNLVTAPADGSAQSAYNFTLTTPSFKGAAGRRDPSTYLEAASASTQKVTIGSNTTFTNSLHKAGAEWTVLGWLMMPSTTVRLLTTADQSTTSSNGVVVNIDPSGILAAINNNSGSPVYSYGSVSSGGIATNSPICVGVTCSASINKIRPYVNGYYSAGATTNFAAASASNATNLADIMFFGTPYYSPQFTRAYSFMMWNRALAQSELDAVFNNTRSRWGV